MRKFLKIAKKTALDILFPFFCPACGKEGELVCDRCLEAVPLKKHQVCFLCEQEPTPHGSACRRCLTRKDTALDAIITAASYENVLVKQLIHNLKYRFVAENSARLAILLLKTLRACEMPLPDILIPVPLHRRRLRWRGFNQSSLLAREFSRTLAPPLEIPVIEALERTKYTRPQMEIKTYESRFENVRDIFRLARDFPAGALKGKIILLVDDIATTGATLEENARILKNSGARKVYAAVIARQALKK